MAHPQRKRSVVKRVAIGILIAVAVVVLGTAAISAYCILGTRADVHTIAQIEAEDIHADAILVLGASVKADGTPSDILADRLEVAADLYLSGAASAIIVSGDNRSPHYNESDAMKRYVASLGVSEDAIYVDHAGYDTYASVYRAHNVYGADSLMVVTQAYHLYRALMIGDMLGMQTVGVAADKGNYDNQFMYSVRELVSRDVDFFMALFKIPPEEPDQTIGL